MKTRLISVANRLATAVFGERIGVYNGVAVRDRGFLDVNDDDTAYKQELVGAVEQCVSTGDRVVVVGGGRSVVAVRAARRGALVAVYEAEQQAAELARHAAMLNKVRLFVEHAVVGEPGEIPDGGVIADRVIDPSELSGDVLVLDCEGAETDILPVKGFETVIVETHPEFGATFADIEAHLENPRVVGSDPVDGEVVVDE